MRNATPVSDCGGKAAAFARRNGKAVALATAVRNVLVLALLLAACGRHERQMQLEREAVLRQYLGEMRAAIAKHRADHGRYPSSLDELVPNYLRNIRVDPITAQADWRLITEETVAVSSDFTTAQTPKPTISVLDVKSKATGTDSSGKPYSEY